MLKTIDLFNEKGNVKVAVRNAVRESAMPILEGALASTGRKVVVGTDGAFYVALAVETDGTPIYARLEASISVKDPFAVVEKKTATKSDPIVIEL